MQPVLRILYAPDLDLYISPLPPAQHTIQKWYMPGGDTMVPYILAGAVIGSIVGHLIPPGYLFWFVVGSVSGYLAQRYFGTRF